jgi:hypothetical protein
VFGIRLGHGTEGYWRIERNSKKRAADGMKKAPGIEAGASNSVPILAWYDLSLWRSPFFNLGCEWVPVMMAAVNSRWVWRPRATVSSSLTSADDGSVLKLLDLSQSPSSHDKPS